MQFMYVDESGDPGIYPPSPSRYFVLSGLVIHELKWEEVKGDFIALRRAFKAQYGLKLRDEIHASAFIHKPGGLKRIPKYQRMEILRKVLDWAATRPELSVTTIVFDKTLWSDSVFIPAWQTLIQRFENTISYKNFPSPKWVDNRGLLIPDNTNGMELIKLLQQMRQHNPIRTSYGAGYRNMRLKNVIEDPFLKDSSQSYFHQIVDVIAYFARQRFEPNAYMRKNGGRNYYTRLLPILNTKASSSDPLGIVMR